MKVKEETGWLIETPDHDGTPLYLSLKGTSLSFLRDHFLACRFARRQDADVMREKFAPGDHVKSVEHSWFFEAKLIETEPAWQCGKCDQIKRGVKDDTLEHTRRCLNRKTPPLPEPLSVDHDTVAQVQYLTITLNQVIAYLKYREG